jgi:hypothetical protein
LNFADKIHFFSKGVRGMNIIAPDDHLNINHEHKTWTPQDRIYYEKQMVFFRLKIGGIIFGAALLLVLVLSKIFL